MAPLFPFRTSTSFAQDTKGGQDPQRYLYADLGDPANTYVRFDHTAIQPRDQAILDVLTTDKEKDTYRRSRPLQAHSELMRLNDLESADAETAFAAINLSTTLPTIDSLTKLPYLTTKTLSQAR